MDGLAGVYSRRGAPIADSVVARMLGMMQSPADPHARVNVPGRAVMACTLTRARPAEDRVAVSGQDAIAVAGRIDNLPELRRHPATRARAAAEVLLALYRARGLHAVGSVVGEFAFGLWDDARQSLTLCCDGLGRRKLYYRITPDFVFWCSESRPLVMSTPTLEDVDEQFVADFLANAAPGRSPYRGVAMLDGGRALDVGATHVREHRYWSVDPSREVRYASDERYEEHFREVFAEAVRCRIAAPQPVLCELSGGLDSTSIACVAQRLIADGSAEATCLQAVSQVYLEAPTSDERRYIHAAAPYLSQPTIEISELECPLLQPLPAGAAPDHPTNALVCLSYYDRLAALLSGLGGDVVLSGIGGDQLFLSETTLGFPLVDIAARGRWPTLVREAGRWARQHRTSVARTLWLGGVAPLLPRRLQAAVMPGYETAPWIDRRFRARTDFVTRQLPLQDDVGFALPTSAIQYGIIRHSMRPFALDRFTARGALDVEYPYLDRRLVEFALAIPLDQKLRLGETRSVVRRALRGIVPSAVLERRTKAGPEEAFFRALQREWPRLSALTERPLVAELGYVDAAPFRQALRLAAHGRASSPGQLMCTLSLEFWLRAIEQRSERADPDGTRQPESLTAIGIS